MQGIKTAFFSVLLLCCVAFFSVGEIHTKPLPKLRLPSEKLIGNLGDYYYQQKKYQYAQIEYERALQLKKQKSPYTVRLRNKLALSLLHQDDFDSASSLLEVAEDFTGRYLGMFTALRMGHVAQALRLQGEILAIPNIAPEKKEEVLLLGGTAYIEQATHNEYKEAKAFFAKLQKQSKSRHIRRQSGLVLNEIDIYLKKPRKKPWVAGMLATVLPGSAHIYAEHYTDGVLAFLFNTLTLGTAIVLYDLERQAERPHYASGVMAAFGINFYIANILGGIHATRRYNYYEQSLFYKQLRNNFFNTKYAEERSALKF